MKLEIERKGLFGRRRKVVNAPKRWGELTLEQYRAVVRWWIVCNKPGASDKEKKGAVVEMLARLLGLPRTVVRQIGDYPMWEILERLEYLRDLSKPHADFFLKKIGKLQAPGARLNGVSLQKYMTADTYFQLSALNPEDTGKLDLFIAALYNKAGEYYSVEEAPVPSEAKLVDMDKNLAEVKKASQEDKLLVFFNFILIRSWLSKSFPWLFPMSEPDERQGIDKKVTPWVEIFDAFVGDNVADMAKYRAMNCIDAFRVMNRKLKQNR